MLSMPKDPGPVFGDLHRGHHVRLYDQDATVLLPAQYLVLDELHVCLPGRCCWTWGQREDVPGRPVRLHARPDTPVELVAGGGD